MKIISKNIFIATFVAIVLSSPQNLFAQNSSEKAPVTSEKKLKSADDIIKEAHAGVSYVSVDSLKTRIKENKKLVLLDVRSTEEYQAGHLKGASWVERGVAEFVMVRQLADPDAEIVVYCKVGHRASLVFKALKNVGYNNVKVLEGGFDAWAEEGNSIYNYLGEFKMVRLIKRNASSLAVDFYEPKE